MSEHKPPIGYYTNLASEFYVLSVLNRKHIDCYLTLGSRKSIDIVGTGDTYNFTIDVKGTRNGEWLMGGKEPTKKENHFYALVHYKGKFLMPEQLPDVYIVPSKKIKKFLSNGGKGYGIKFNPDTRHRMRFYLNNWEIFFN